VLMSAICVHCDVRVTAHLELVGSFWVGMRAVSTGLLPHATVWCLQINPDAVLRNKNGPFLVP